MGPLVDSLHNQCLLKYNIAPISLNIDDASLGGVISAGSNDPIFTSSWLIPPLLGVAYVVLGGVLPRLFSFSNISDTNGPSTKPGSRNYLLSNFSMKEKAITAVVSTAIIIRLSEFLQTHAIFEGIGGGDDKVNAFLNLAVMLIASISQWLLLDGTFPSLIAASVTSIGGPLAELPFVASGCWEYIPTSADYLPLSSLPDWADSLSRQLLGDGYRGLALSSITGPCYFAVTMDAIALGRWFDTNKEE